MNDLAHQQINDGLRELALFAGAGGGILGGKLLGWRTVCAVERDAYAAQVLAQRQNDGCLEPFPIWSDVCTFDGSPWRGIVDVVSGGFPCQDISAAGRGAGIGGEKSGLWKQMARIVSEVQPRFVFIENSPLLRSRGLNVVLKDLAALGYDAKWGVLGAYHVGAPHKRERIWIVANSESKRCRETREFRSEQPEERVASSSQKVADTNSERFQVKRAFGSEPKKSMLRSFGRQWHRWPTEPDVGRVAHGVANRVDRLRAVGNGQVPIVAATAWRILTEDFEI